MMTIDDRIKRINRRVGYGGSLYVAVIQEMKNIVEDCATIVCPVPHIEEERDCREVANEIRKLAG